MHFNTIAIINEHIFMLRNCKVRLVVEKSTSGELTEFVETDFYLRDVPAGFSQLKFRMQCSRLPVKSCDMACFSNNGKMSMSNVRVYPWYKLQSTDLPFRVYLDLYGPPSRFHSRLPFAASCPAAATTSSCPTLHVLSSSPSTSIFPESSAANRDAVSFTSALLRALCSDCRVNSARSFLSGTWLYLSASLGGGEAGRSDFGSVVCGASDLRVLSSTADLARAL